MGTVPANARLPDVAGALAALPLLPLDAGPGNEQRKATGDGAPPVHAGGNRRVLDILLAPGLGPTSPAGRSSPVGTDDETPPGPVRSVDAKRGATPEVGHPAGAPGPSGHAGTLAGGRPQTATPCPVRGLAPRGSDRSTPGAPGLAW